MITILFVIEKLFALQKNHIEFFQVVEKLFQVTSNFGSEPTTPGKQWEEFQEISQLVERIRAIEQGYSMCRTLPDRRSAVKPFLEWLTQLGAVFHKAGYSCFTFDRIHIKQVS